MQLPFLNKRESKKDYFLSLLVKPQKVGAILFEEEGQKLVILASHEVEVSNDTDNIPQEELLAASDKVISFLEGSLPEGASVEKVLFSLPWSWITDSKIKPEYLNRLKGVCSALELKPIGYLTSIEAIVHFIEKQEGAPASAIFIEVSKNNVITYLVRAGKILDVGQEKIEENVILTSENLFRKIHIVDVLPAKIILLDYDGASETQQDFLSHRWPRDIPFLHLPQVVVLEKGFENEATVNGVATQMELEVSQDIKTHEYEPIEEEKLEEAGDDFGFVKEGEEPVAPIPDANVAAAAAGAEGVMPAVSEVESNVGEPDVNYFNTDGDDSINEQEANIPNSHESKLPVPINFQNILDKFKNIKMPPLPISNSKNTHFKIGGGFIAVAVILLLLSFVYYNFILSSRVVIFADKKVVDKTTDITFAKDPTVDNSIRMIIASEEIKGDDTKNSTGQKETGEKAKGSVTIYNKTDDKKSFPKGTIVVGPNNLEFELQDDISIASTSAFSTSLTSVSGKVLAAKLGKEYNIPSNSNFTVKGFSAAQFIGKNSDSFSGGSKKTTTVVSKKDLDTLLSDVASKYKKDAVEKAQKDAEVGETIFPEVLAFEVVDKKYTKKEGDEAGSVGVTATIKYDVGKYSEQDVKEFVESISKNEVPSSYKLKQDDLKTEITNIKIDEEDKNSVTAKLKFNATYAPDVDTKKIAEGLKGKSQSDAEKQIKSIAGINDVVISYVRKLPFFPIKLPGSSSNINIEVKN